MVIVFALVAHALAWVCLTVALPPIWLAGFWRGLAYRLVAPDPPPARETSPAPRRYHGGAVLTEADVAILIGAHEGAMRRGEAKWQ